MAIRAARVLLLAARERRDLDWVPLGGPFHYRDVWVRDGARVTEALAVSGYTRESRELARGLLRFQTPIGTFVSQAGQLDGTGQMLWALEQTMLRPSPAAGDRRDGRRRGTGVARAGDPTSASPRRCARVGSGSAAGHRSARRGAGARAAGRERCVGPGGLPRHRATVASRGQNAGGRSRRALATRLPRRVRRCAAPHGRADVPPSKGIGIDWGI
jgi:hypothetical protein